MQCSKALILIYLVYGTRSESGADATAVVGDYVIIISAFKQARAKSAAQSIPDADRGCQGGSRQSGDRRRRLYYTRRPEGRGNDLASKRSEAQPKTLLVFCRLKDQCMHAGSE